MSDNSRQHLLLHTVVQSSSLSFQPFCQHTYAGCNTEVSAWLEVSLWDHSPPELWSRFLTAMVCSIHSVISKHSWTTLSTQNIHFLASKICLPRKIVSGQLTKYPELSMSGIRARCFENLFETASFCLIAYCNNPAFTILRSTRLNPVKLFLFSSPSFRNCSQSFSSLAQTDPVHFYQRSNILKWSNPTYLKFMSQPCFHVILAIPISSSLVVIFIPILLCYTTLIPSA